ncbi:MAG: hypothetical protein KC646_14935 [Candidatus Cloacimonetes bacterium]|nr:hypothetical protein [Candidatus Cloacimonadota bacterium]
MLKVLIFIVFIACNYSDDFFSDISKEVEQKEDKPILYEKLNLDKNPNLTGNNPSQKIKSLNYLTSHKIPIKKLFFYWVSQKPKEIERLLELLTTYDIGFTINQAVVDEKTLDDLFKLDQSNISFLIEKQIKKMETYSNSKVMRSIFIEIRNVTRVLDQSLPFLLESYPKAYLRVIESQIPPFLKYVPQKKHSSRHAYLSMHLVLSVLKSDLQRIQSINTILRFTDKKQNLFKVLYLSTSLKDRSIELLKQLDKMKIDYKDFFATQGDRSHLGRLLLSVLLSNPDYDKEFISHLSRLQLLLDQVSVNSKQDLLNDKKWFHPHIKSLINDDSKERLIRLLLRVLPQNKKQEIQLKLSKVSQLELFEDSLVLSQSVREASLHLTPELIVELRKSSLNFREFEVFFPKAYHFACRLIIAQYYQYLNESLIKQIPSSVYQRFMHKFRKKQQKSFTLDRRALLFSAKSLSILKEDNAKIEEAAFKRSWLILEKDLIWFHRLILSFRIDLDLHHFDFSKATIIFLQEKLSKSIHFTDLFTLLDLQEKKKLASKFLNLKYFTLRLVEEELYLLEKKNENQSLVYKESFELYKALNEILAQKVKRLTVNINDERFKSLQSYYAKSDYIRFKDMIITIRSVKQSKDKKILLSDLKQISKNLRNLIYLIQI